MGVRVYYGGKGILWQYLINKYIVSIYRYRVYYWRVARAPRMPLHLKHNLSLIPYRVTRGLSLRDEYFVHEIRSSAQRCIHLHAVPVLCELGVRVSVSRLYNEYRDQVERVRGLRVASRSVVLWPRVSVSKV